MATIEVRPNTVLASLPLFGEMDEDELATVAEASVFRSYERGETIVERGDPCVGFHVVVHGQVKLFVISQAGQEKVVEIISPGQSFGEAVMFLDKPYIVTAAALRDSLVLHVSKRAVLGEIEREPRFALRMMAGISRRLHGLVNDVEGYALRSGMQRVIGYLLRDIATGGGAKPALAQVVHLDVTKATLASRLSLTPEYFSRVLHELREAGLIEVTGRQIRIPDPHRLASHQL